MYQVLEVHRNSWARLLSLSSTVVTADIILPGSFYEMSTSTQVLILKGGADFPTTLLPARGTTSQHFYETS